MHRTGTALMLNCMDSKRTSDRGPGQHLGALLLVLRKRGTNLFFKAEDNWVENPKEAQPFLRIEEIMYAVRKHGMGYVEMVWCDYATGRIVQVKQIRWGDEGHV